MPRRPTRASPHSTDRSFAARYGRTILAGGIAAIPMALFRYQGELGLNPPEVWFTCYILAHRWDSDLPYPSLSKLARQSGVDRRQLQRYCHYLEEKGLLTITKRGGVPGQRWGTNVYDFSGLFARLEALLQRDQDAIPNPVAATPPDPCDTVSHPMRQSVPSHAAQRRIPRGRVPHHKQESTDGEANDEKATRPRQPPTKRATPLPGQVHPVVARLISAGVTERVAQALEEEYGPEACLRQLDWLPHRKARDPAAVLVRAIKENWIAPLALEQDGRTSHVGASHEPVSLGAILQQAASRVRPGVQQC